MNKREMNLLRELRDRHDKCRCGGIYYPEHWMTKTREKLVRDGVLLVKDCCPRNGWLVLIEAARPGVKGE